MKPVLTTPERMILRARPWALGISLALAILVFAFLTLGSGMHGDWMISVCLGLVLLGLVLTFVLFIRQEVVILDRGARLVVIRVATLFGQTETRRELAGLKGAEVETRHTTSTTKSRTHRPVLRYRDGTALPLTDIFAGGDGAERNAQAINAWLTGHKG